ncbi:MAG: ABC transporter permease [Thermoleophilia bacterium]|nr:ABC transporter permease [Thermoleophilia bacterium]
MVEPAAAVTAGRRRGPVPRKLWFGLGVVLVAAMIGALAPWLAPYDPSAQSVAKRLEAPSAEHLLGTDALGRDQLSRILYGARVDLAVALLAVTLPMLLGLAIGSTAGYAGGWWDTVAMRVADLVQAFPVYVLLIALAFALGAGVRSVLVAFLAIGWVAYARLGRAEVLRVRSLDYVLAAHLGGLGRLRVLWRHVLPNVVSQPLVYMASDVVVAMTTFAALSYLGLGVQPPTAEWGAMIADGQPYLRDQWWLSVAPGGAIVIVGLGFSLVGDGLDDHLRR